MALVALDDVISTARLEGQQRISQDPVKLAKSWTQDFAKPLARFVLGEQLEEHLQRELKTGANGEDGAQQRVLVGILKWPGCVQALDD